MLLSFVVSKRNNKKFPAKTYRQKQGQESIQNLQKHTERKLINILRIRTQKLEPEEINNKRLKSVTFRILKLFITYHIITKLEGLGLFLVVQQKFKESAPTDLIYTGLDLIRPLPELLANLDATSSIFVETYKTCFKEYTQGRDIRMR